MFVCECGENSDYALIDGYAFGETLLEGVMFEVHEDAKGKISVQVANDDLEYFSGLNTKKWLKAALACAKEDRASYMCPHCHNNFY